VVAQLAGLLGYEEDKELFLSRSENYRNVIDSEGTGFVRGRHANGAWYGKDEAFDPTQQYSWLTEATAWQYTW
jgi:putative alpha-1,2-mannosidase